MALGILHIFTMGIWVLVEFYCIGGAFHRNARKIRGMNIIRGKKVRCL